MKTEMCQVLSLWLYSSPIRLHTVHAWFVVQSLDNTESWLQLWLQCISSLTSVNCSEVCRQLTMTEWWHLYSHSCTYVGTSVCPIKLKYLTGTVVYLLFHVFPLLVFNNVTSYSNVMQEQGAQHHSYGSPRPVPNLSVAGYIGECVKKLPAFQTMSKDGQFLDGTLFDICCVTVVSYLIWHHCNMTFKSEI